jgi:hypothetical protein
MTVDAIFTFEFPFVFKFIAAPRKLNITEYHISNLTQEIQGFEISFTYVPVVSRVTGFKTTKKPVLLHAQTEPCNQLPK